MKILKPALFISACMAMVLLVSCTKTQPPNLLVNSGFEELTKTQKPVGWGAVQHAGKVAYSHEIDTDVVFEKVQSYRMEQHADQAYGVVKQFVVLPDKESKTFSYTAMMKTEDVAAGMGWRLVLNCRSRNNGILKQYQSEGMNGTTDWKKVTLEGDLPKGTVKLDAGIMLQSIGIGWVDHTYLSVD